MSIWVKRARSLAIAASLVAIAAFSISGLKQQSVLPANANGTPKVVRIGYFANLTHAPAIIASQKRLFQENLPGSRVEFTTFSVGTAEIEALKGGALDFGYVGPAPAISGYVTTQGTLLNVIAGAATNGAMLVVRPGLVAKPGMPTTKEIRALSGKTLADPGLGGTQDVALRSFFKQLGMWRNGYPSANIIPMANADTLALFEQGKIDGAWLPEPWATRMIQEAGARVFLDERTLWPTAKFATTVLVATQKFENQFPAAVAGVVNANQSAINFLNLEANRSSAINLIQAELEAKTGKTLAPKAIAQAYINFNFDSDPAIFSIKQDYANATDLGQLPTGSPTGIRGLFNLKALNKIRTAAGLKPVAVAKNLK